MKIHTVVSGALDRLHYERDPCVKYDSNRKVWIYLHRDRSEEEFGKIWRSERAKLFDYFICHVNVRELSTRETNETLSFDQAHENRY